MADDACRADVWLWRARFCKTRALASRLLESGRVRITRGGQRSRLDKPSRAVRPGDELVFAVGGRLTAIRIEALGVRRGPPVEAKNLYVALGANVGCPVDRADECPASPEECSASNDRWSRH